MTKQSKASKISTIVYIVKNISLWKKRENIQKLENYISFIYSNSG